MYVNDILSQYVVARLALIPAAQTVCVAFGFLLPFPSGDVAIPTAVPNHPFSAIGGMRAHGGEPLLGIEDLPFLTLFRCKAVMQVTTIQITVNYFLETRTKEAIGPLKTFFLDLDEHFQMALDEAIIIGYLRMTGPVYG